MRTFLRLVLSISVLGSDSGTPPLGPLQNPHDVSPVDHCWTLGLVAQGHLGDLLGLSLYRARHEVFDDCVKSARLSSASVDRESVGFRWIPFDR